MLEAAWSIRLRIALAVGGAGDRARHAGRAGAGAARALPRPAGILGMIYAPLVMPEVITGLSLLAAVRGDRHRARLLDGHHRPHHADDVLRHRGRAVAPRRLRPQPGGGGDGSRLPAAAGLPRRDAAADRAGDRRRLDAGLHAVARRSGDRELHHRPRRDDAADPDLFGGAARGEAGDQRDLHDHDRVGRGGDRDGFAARANAAALAARRHCRRNSSGGVTGVDFVLRDGPYGPPQDEVLPGQCDVRRATRYSLFWPGGRNR